MATHVVITPRSSPLAFRWRSYTVELAHRRTRSSARTPSYRTTAREPQCQFFLTELLWFMQSDLNLLGAKRLSIHGMHRHARLFRSLEGYKTKPSADAIIPPHHSSTNNLSKLVQKQGHQRDVHPKAKERTALKYVKRSLESMFGSRF